MIDDYHPDLRRIARFAPSGSFTPRTLRLARAGTALRGVVGPRHVQVVPLDSGAGAAVRVHRPAGLVSPSPALLWIHGGCYVLGSARADDKLCKRFAQKLNIVVASVEYRVAPENPYPAALDDCVAALKWLTSQAEVDPSRTAIGGASSGGGLAAALALRVRAESFAKPVLQLLTYPMLDDRPACRPDADSKRRRLMDQGMNRFGWDSYLRGVDPTEAVPARAESLTALPPAWIGVGTLDLLYTEDLEYAQRLREAGVSCSLEVVPGAFHGFDLVAPNLAVSRGFFESQCTALKSALGI